MSDNTHTVRKQSEARTGRRKRKKLEACEGSWAWIVARQAKKNH